MSLEGGEACVLEADNDDLAFQTDPSPAACPCPRPRETRKTVLQHWGDGGGHGARGAFLWGRRACGHPCPCDAGEMGGDSLGCALTPWALQEAHVP